MYDYVQAFHNDQRDVNLYLHNSWKRQ